MKRLVLLTLCLTLLWSGSSLGCIPRDDSKGGRPSDGKLKCYGCNSREHPLCGLDQWKYANQTVRRVLNRQCPGRLSSFCYLKLSQEGPKYTERGCFRNKFQDNTSAAVGCINEGTQYRVCLCDKDLCNSAPFPDLHIFGVLASPTESSLFVVFVTLLIT